MNFYDFHVSLTIMCASQLPLAHKIITFHTTVTFKQKLENTSLWEEAYVKRIWTLGKCAIEINYLFIIIYYFFEDLRMKQLFELDKCC